MLYFEPNLIGLFPIKIAKIDWKSAFVGLLDIDFGSDLKNQNQLIPENFLGLRYFY